LKTAEEILELLRQDEGPTLEFKESSILRNTLKLARTVAAFANSKGGIFLIGVKDDKSIEGMKAEKSHEELIMNVASDKCDPRIIPKFEKVTIPEKGDVYIIQVPEKQDTYHAVKIKDGITFPIRVGSTIRQLSASELGYGLQGIEIEPKIRFGKFGSWFGKKALYKIYGRLDADISRFLLGILSVGLATISISLFFMIRYENGRIEWLIINYPTWLNLILLFGLVIGFLIIEWVRYTPSTKCPNCNSYFSFYTARKWVFKKRPIDKEREEWITRNLKKCNECGYELLGRKRYETVSIEDVYS